MQGVPILVKRKSYKHTCAYANMHTHISAHSGRAYIKMFTVIISKGVALWSPLYFLQFDFLKLIPFSSMGMHYFVLRLSLPILKIPLLFYTKFFTFPGVSSPNWILSSSFPSVPENKSALGTERKKKKKTVSHLCIVQGENKAATKPPRAHILYVQWEHYSRASKSWTYITIISSGFLGFAGYD